MAQPTHDMPPPHQLAYRRQFVLGPEWIPGTEDWKRIDLPGGGCLAVHPELPICNAQEDDKGLLLLGYVLDPYHPDWSNEDILAGLTEQMKAADDLFDLLTPHGGRYVIIARFGDHHRIFHDPGGLRQVFYHVDPQGRSWVGSQPNLFASHAGLAINPAIEEDFQRSAIFAAADYWFPGTATLYDNVHRLMPNHYFDLQGGHTARYWPRRALPSVSFREGVERCSTLLPGMVTAASKRSRLALGLSCGMDSRLLFAACRPIASDVRFFTQRSPAMDEDDPDIVLPRELCRRLGCTHTTLPLHEELPPDFRTALGSNVMAAKEGKGINAYSITRDLLKWSTDTTVVYGNLNEIVKRDRFRYPEVPRILVSGPFLTQCARMTGSRIARRELSDWLSSVRPLTRFRVNILNLMHWEHRVGSWAAMTFSEYDTGFETLCPYNCRAYIETMWGVPFRYRTMPDYRLFRAMIERMWPEALDIDILTLNRERNRLKHWLLDTLYRTWSYDMLKYLYLLLYKRPLSQLRGWKSEGE